MWCTMNYYLFVLSYYNIISVYEGSYISFNENHWPHYLAPDHSRQEEVSCHLTATILISS